MEPKLVSIDGEGSWISGQISDMVVRSGPARLTLQRSSQFKIHDECSKRYRSEKCTLNIT